MIYIKIFRCNHLQENSILLWDDTLEGVVVDPGFYWDEEFAALDQTLRGENISLKGIWLTHAHFDHFYGVGPIVFSLPGDTLRGYIGKDWTDLYAIKPSVKKDDLPDDEIVAAKDQPLVTLTEVVDDDGKKSYQVKLSVNTDTVLDAIDLLNFLSSTNYYVEAISGHLRRCPEAG